MNVTSIAQNVRLFFSKQNLAFISNLMITLIRAYRINLLFMFQLLGFMLGWLTFYHQGHEVGEDFKPYMKDLQFRIQKVRI